MVEWCGEIDFNGWSADEAASRRAQIIERARVAGIYCGAEGDDFLVLRWQAPPDENAAYRTLAELVGVEPGDFVSGRPARRL